MKKYGIITHKNQKSTVQRKQKLASVATFSKCKLIRCRDVISKITEDDRIWIQNKREENLYNQSYLVTMFLEKTARLHLSLEREVFFHISTNNYFLDFLDQVNCIAIEIDGSQHNTKEALMYDYRRDKLFRFIGIQTIRFVRNELEDRNFVTNYFLPKYEKAFKQQYADRKEYETKLKKKLKKNKSTTNS